MMEHAITVGGLLTVAVGIVGLVLLAVGCLMTFAGMMSSNPSAGSSASNTGCIVIVIGLALTGLSAWALFT